ncbi:SRPBCC domain-containing protein [Actinoplanes missouriensis]|uniref:SRPBCC domain-containing protein n=1 Tax=Actinoplanes missouriensis TaxID=1866 RepID=UPI00340E14E5
MTPDAADTSSNDASGDGRQPIRQSTVVRSDRAHTFAVFVRDIGQWWPTQPFSLGQERVTAVTFEQRLGGRVYETWADGTEVGWGEVITWRPPERFAMTWTVVPGVVTEVEVAFAALGPALTRVTLEHRGWEKLATAVPGGYTAGWKHILNLFTAAAEAAAAETTNTETTTTEGA